MEGAAQNYGSGYITRRTSIFISVLYPVRPGYGVRSICGKYRPLHFTYNYLAITLVGSGGVRLYFGRKGYLKSGSSQRGTAVRA